MSAASAKVVIGLSGGVDSAVAAALLVEQGYQVIGIMLRLWSEPGCEGDNRCCTPQAMALARRVAAQLGIPFYAVDAQQVHFDEVVGDFIAGYSRGITPNPCLACNRWVRWGFMRQHALNLGASYLATGHYARLQSQSNGLIKLMRGVDPRKDQSYVLHMLDQIQLSQTMLPIGGLTKQQVRQFASDRHLPVADRSDSQDLCFLGGADYRGFLRRFAPETFQPGPIMTRSGEIVGQHQGLANYTIGQRKGLQLSASIPHYVLAKDVAGNTLIVGPSAELGGSHLQVERINWISGSPPTTPFRALVKTRYTAEPAWAEVHPITAENAAEVTGAGVTFERPQRDITPGQAAVFYDGDLCLGGGVIVGQ